MPQHTDNYILKLPETLPAPPANQKNFSASDLHINATDASVEVLGIDGIDPDGPVSPHSVGIDANGAIDITGINVKPGETVRLRLKHKKNNARLALAYYWTYPNGAKGNAGIQNLAMLDEQMPEDGAASVASAGDLRPLLEALLEAIGPTEARPRRPKG